MIADILLVDDNCIQATTRKAILGPRGRERRGCVRWEDRLLPCSIRGGLLRPVGLVVTDHLMPGMNGPQFVAPTEGEISGSAGGGAERAGGSRG